MQTISARAFFGTKLTGLDMSEAASLVEIGAWAFVATGLEGTLIIPAKLTKIGPSAFDSAKLTGLDLSKATSLVNTGTLYAQLEVLNSSSCLPDACSNADIELSRRRRRRHCRLAKDDLHSTTVTGQ